MREILFRGKRVDNGEWVKGFLSKSRNIEEKPALLKPCIDYEEKGVMMSGIVDPETVGQFTGLTDKNGNKIFEGDIIEGKCSKNRKQRFRVWWHTSLCCFIAGELGQTRPGFNPGTMVNYEVIGNVYDNPELLEENKI